MKKLFFTFILVFCLAAGFAETGYRGFKWYCNYSDFPKAGQFTVDDIGGIRDTLFYPIFYEKKILDTRTFLFYGFDYNTKELKSAGYIIPKGKTVETKKQFKNLKKKELKVDFSEMQDFIEELDEEKKAKEYILFSTFATTSIQINSATIKELENDLKSSKGKNTIITIYDYNDDTRCYIYENIVPGSTVVIYIPHEQDY